MSISAPRPWKLRWPTAGLCQRHRILASVGSVVTGYLAATAIHASLADRFVTGALMLALLTGILQSTGN